MFMMFLCTRVKDRLAFGPGPKLRVDFFHRSTLHEEPWARSLRSSSFHTVVRLTAVVQPGRREAQRDCNLARCDRSHTHTHWQINTCIHTLAHKRCCTDWWLLMQMNNQSCFWAVLTRKYGQINKWSESLWEAERIDFFHLSSFYPM